jgi:hypothetical protein
VAGTGHTGYGGTGGPAASATINNDGIAIDSNGRLLIAEPANRIIRRIG